MTDLFNKTSEISITAVDLAGNDHSSTTLTGGAALPDIERPITITVNSFLSDNSTNTDKAKTDDIITLDFTSDIPIATPAITDIQLINGDTTVNANDVSGGPLNFVASWNIVSDSVEGNYTSFDLLATDSVSGSTTRQFSSQDATGVVTVDNTDPIFNAITLTSDGTTLDLSFNCNESLSALPTVTICDLTPTDLSGDITLSTVSYTHLTLPTICSV